MKIHIYLTMKLLLNFLLLIKNLLEDGRRRERMGAAAASVLPRGAAGLVADVLEGAAR